MILSGYADFSYAQQAMQNDCTDYILKPVDKEMLLKVLNKVLVLKNEKNQIDEDNKKMKQAYLARHLISLIQGKYDEVNLNYVKEKEIKMKHVKTLNTRKLQNTVKKGGCGECQTSCQSACKTSCTVGNQTCEQYK